MKHITALLLVAVLAGCAARVESLPPPVVNDNSLEIISNSRYSSHSGFAGSLSDTVLSNVLWAMSRVPSLGSSYRELYVATPSNVYLYDPASHVLNLHLIGDHRYEASAAFEVGIAVERDEEAGLVAQAGLLAGDAFWSRGGGVVASCPKVFAAEYANSNWSPIHPINIVDVFGRKAVRGLRDSCVAISSDMTLPLPLTDRPDTFEVLVNGLSMDSTFTSSVPSLSMISQLLWAGYGVTPHLAEGGVGGGQRGLTVPSAGPYYYLTGRILVVRADGVDRYHNRLPPGTDHWTGDHRLEAVASGDRRDALRAACSRLPATAPLYVVVCIADTANSLRWKLLDAGFPGLQYLMQAHALGLHGWLTAPIAPHERTAIIAALGLPATDLPVLVFSVGFAPSSGAVESGRSQTKRPSVERTTT